MQIVERGIGLQETHIYEFSLDAGEFVRFDVEQKNVDPQLVISDAGGKQLREIYFERIVGRTAISFIAVEKAKFRLILKPSGKSKMDGSYRLQMSRPRLSNETDRQRIKAEVALNGRGLTVRNAEKPREKITTQQRQERLTVLQKLVVEWQKLNEPNFEAETWHQIGLVANKLLKVELAKTAFEKLQGLAQANKGILEEAWALYHLANLAKDRGEHETSEKYLMTAIEFAKKSGAKTVEAEIYNRLANHYRDSAKYEKARDYLEKEVNIYREIKSEVDVAKARVSLALVSERLDKNFDSSSIYQEALAVFEKHKAFYEKGFVLRILGANEADKKRFEVAEKYFNESLVLMEKYGEPDDEAFVLFGLGLLKLGRNNADAGQYLEKALSKLSNDSDLKTKVKVLTALGRLDVLQGKVAESLEKFKTALEIANRIGLQSDKILLNNLLSQIYVGLGQNETALNYALVAKKLSDESQDKSLRGTSTNSLAGIYQFQGNYPEAIELFEESIKLGEESKQNALVVLSYQRLGGIYLELSDLNRAEKTYLKAIELSEKIDNPTMKRALVLSVVQVYLRQNKLAEARKKLEALLEEVKNNTDTLIEAYTQQLLGNLALKEKDYTTAQAKFTAALTLQSKAKIVLGIALALQGLGDTFTALGNSTQAQNLYGQTLALFRQIDGTTGEATIFENLMNLERKNGNNRLAIFYGKQSVNLLQSVRGSIKPLDAEIRRSFLSSVENVYRTLAAILIEEGRISEAQDVLSLLKEEEFHQFTRRSSNSMPSSFHQLSLNTEETEAAQKYKEITDGMTLMKQRLSEIGLGQPLAPEKLSEMQRLQTELAGINKKFVEFLKELTVKFSQSKTASTLGTSKSQTQVWQKKLTEFGAGAVLLTTLLTENRYYVIITTPNRQVARFKEISFVELTQKVKQLREVLEHPKSLVLGDPRSTAQPPVMQEIYQTLVKPIEADLLQMNAKTLLWSLDGVLRYLPFAALHDGQNYLVEKYTNVVVTLAQPPADVRVSPKGWRALGAGVSKPIGDFAPLPQVEIELKTIVRDETAKKRRDETGFFIGRRLLNQDFSRSNFADSLKQKFQLVHLATHFVFGSGKDIDSFLLLGNDDRLTLAQLRTDKQFDFDGVDLLTLSACETGLSTLDANGVEVESFAVIAQRRGAKTVMASLWRIPHVSTKPLMKEFYRQYKNGKGGISKAEALRQAQITLLKNSKPNQAYTHPAYWGAFIIIGNL
jgi:CHAT domain-containing protein/uncharacterized protein HemY